MPRARLALALLALGGPAPLAAAPCLEAVGEAEVTGSDAYATLRLGDGRAVRLADIVPAGGSAAPDAIGRLAGLAGQAVEVRRSGDATEGGDRYGRIVGDVAPKATGDSLSQQLLREGLALVDPAVMSDECLDALFAAEREAERARRGLWDDTPVLGSADPGLASAAGRYVLVEGVVRTIGETRETIYLNFGSDYRNDFTALIRREDANGWADTLLAFEGRNVRIRGVLEAWNGGLIRVEHLRQIELLPRAGQE